MIARLSWHFRHEGILATLRQLSEVRARYGQGPVPELAALQEIEDAFDPVDEFVYEVYEDARRDLRGSEKGVVTVEHVLHACELHGVRNRTARVWLRWVVRFVDDQLLSWRLTGEAPELTV